MDSPIMLRPADRGDADELATLHLQCRREAYAGLLSESFFDKQNLANRIAAWSQILDGPNADRYWVAVHNGELIGFSGSTPPAPDTAALTELWGIYLLSAYHGQGLGQRLLDATIGTEKATLWVAEANSRAQAFYRRNGFTASGAKKILEDWEGIAVIHMWR